jgi:hypothetical protein
LGASFLFSVPESHMSMAGLAVIATRSLRKLLSEYLLRRRFWAIISCWEPTPAFEVANQSCQLSVMRSTSGRLVRTIRSSHHRWSCP